MLSLKTRRYAQPVAFFVARVMLAALNVLRMLHVPITHDEAGAIDADGIPSYHDIVTFRIVSAANHPLNELLRKFFTDVFGMSVFFLRLDSLLAQLLYISCTYLLSRKLFQQFAARMCAFLVLQLQPFMFEFWGLSRGYGLAVAFMTLAILLFWRYIEEGKLKLLAGAFCAAFLAVYSNFALLHFFVAITGYVILRPVFERRSEAMKPFLRYEMPLVAFFCLSLYLLIGGPIKRLREDGQFYYGGSDGIIKNTVMSLVRENVYMPADATFFVGAVAYIIVVLSAGIGIYWLVQWLRQRDCKAIKAGILFSYLIGVCALQDVVQHYFLHTLYLIDRTALFYVVLFFVQLLHVLAQISKPWLRLGITLALTLCITYNFARNISITGSRSWWFDREDLFVVQKMQREQSTLRRKIKTGIYWPSYPSIHFYIAYCFRNDFEAPVRLDDQLQPDTSYDYLYTQTECKNPCMAYYAVDTNFGFGMTLYRRKMR